MAKELLNRPNIVTAFEQMGGEGMPEGVTGGALCQARLRDGDANALLHERRIHMMPALFARAGVLPAVLLGEGPLPKAAVGRCRV